MRKLCAGSTPTSGAIFQNIMHSPTYMKLKTENPRVMADCRLPDSPAPQLSWNDLLRSNTIAAEFFLASISLGCGIWLLMPFQAFDSPFPVLPGILSETITGLWLTALGVFRLFALKDGNIKIRQYASLFSFATWLNLLAWVVLTNPQLMATIFFTLFALGPLWIFFSGPSPIVRREGEPIEQRNENEK